MAKEHEESSDAVNTMMASGPFIPAERQAPVLNGRYKRTRTTTRSRVPTSTSSKCLEDLMSEEQYKVALVTFGNYWFADPSLRNIQIPMTNVNGSLHYLEYWWFDKA